MTDHVLPSGVFKRSDGRWAWRLVADNGNVIATDGGQGYENRLDCLEMFNQVVSGDYSGNVIIEGETGRSALNVTGGTDTA